jgi:hypothetical protein
MEIAADKILVFDADVLIHFMQAGCFSDLKRIYPENKKVVLQKVYDELQIFKDSKVMLDSAIETFKFLHLIHFPISTEMMKEFAHLTSHIMNMGKGESACMSYCKFTNDVVVSSNLKDVGEYCKRHSIGLITTMDLLHWAYTNSIYTEDNCNAFIKVVLKKGGRLPCQTIQEYITKKKN